MVFSTCLWTYQGTGKFKVGTERELVFGFITKNWHLEQKLKAAPSADCLGIYLAAYFCPSPTFSVPMKGESNIRCIASPSSFVLGESSVMP